MIRISGAYNREVLWVAESGVIQYPGGCKKGHKKIPSYTWYLVKNRKWVQFSQGKFCDRSKLKWHYRGLAA